jgi:hypothetical protein
MLEKSANSTRGIFGAYCGPSSDDVTREQRKSICSR